MSINSDSQNQASETSTHESDYKPVALSITRYRRLEPFLEVFDQSVRSHQISEIYLVV
jgi:hypothetical protein